MSNERVRGQTRQWTDEQMLELIEKINQGYSYQDVTDGTHIPISTLWTRVKGMFQGQIRPKTGAPTLFPSEMEADFALYMKHCCFLTIPRTRSLLKDDILHFVQYKWLTIKNMVEDGPGRTWQDRFANDWKELVWFYSKQEIFRIQNDPITLRDWVHERDNYTRIQLLTKYFSSRKYIFVIEAEKLTIEAANKQEFVVAMIYNAEGEVLSPFVAHKPNMLQSVVDYFKRTMNLFITDNGELDRNCLYIILLSIKLFLNQKNLTAFPIVYLCLEIAKHFNLFAWDVCNNENMVLQTVPCNIYRYFRTCNMGVFEKLKPKFNERAKEEFPDKSKVCLRFNFFEILEQVVFAGKWSAHLRNSCRCLRIVHVSPQVAQVEEEQVDD